MVEDLGVNPIDLIKSLHTPFDSWQEEINLSSDNFFLFYFDSYLDRNGANHQSCSVWLVIAQPFTKVDHVI